MPPMQVRAPQLANMGAETPLADSREQITRRPLDRLRQQTLSSAWQSNCRRAVDEPSLTVDAKAIRAAVDLRKFASHPPHRVRCRPRETQNVRSTPHFTPLSASGLAVTSPLIDNLPLCRSPGRSSHARGCPLRSSQTCMPEGHHPRSPARMRRSARYRRPPSRRLQHRV